MKCPNDQIEMEEGRIGQYGDWDSTGHSTKSLLGNLTGSGKKMKAYRCSKCGKVELKVEEEK